MVDATLLPADQVDFYNTFFATTFVATVWRRVTPVSDFQLTVGSNTDQRLRRKLRAIWRLFTPAVFRTTLAEPTY